MKIFIPVFVIVIIILFFSFYPCFESDFLGKDYDILYKIKKKGFSLNYFNFLSSEQEIEKLKSKGKIPYYTNSKVRENFFRPLSSVLIYLEYKLFKSNAKGYRIINFILFIIAGFVFYLMLSKFLLKPQAIIGTVIFLLGKTHYSLFKNALVIDNVLVFIFIILSLLFFYKYFNQKYKKDLYLCVTFVILSLLTKETGVLSVVFIFAYDVFFIRTGKLFQRVIKTLKKNVLFVFILLSYLLFYFMAGYGAFSLKHVTVLMPFKYLTYVPKTLLMDIYSALLYIPQRGFSISPVSGYMTLTIVSAFLSFIIIFAILYNLKKDWRLNFFGLIFISPMLIYTGVNAPESRLIISLAGFSAIAGIFLYNFFKQKTSNLIQRQTMLVGAILISLFTFFSPLYNNYILRKYKKVSLQYNNSAGKIKKLLGNAFLSWRKILIVFNHNNHRILTGFHSNLYLELETSSLRYHIINPNSYIKINYENENSVVLESYMDYGEYFIGNKTGYEASFLLDYNFKKRTIFKTKHYTVEILKTYKRLPVKIRVITKKPLHSDSILFIRFNSLLQKYETKRFTTSGTFK